ncbi:MAG: glycosyltransferase family 4 protein [Rhodothermales bacterium]
MNEATMDSGAMKRVLIISYYFPPSGGPGVQRVLKFVKYLLDYGWHPTVLTVAPEHASYPDLDPTLVEEIPDSVQVIRTRSWDPYAVYARVQGKQKEETVGVGFVKEEAAMGRTQRLARWIRANVFVPDARVGWVPFALRAAKRLIAARPFDVVYTSGPPHSTHLIGRSLKRRYGSPWVADFRDPWTDISYYNDLPHTAAARRLDAGLERSVLSEADIVLSVSDGVGRLLEARAALRAYHTLPNGYDPADIPEPCEVRQSSEKRFVMAHVGTLTSQQHAAGLVQALTQRAEADPAWRDRLEMRFVGHVDHSILAAFQDAGLSDTLKRVPYVSHAEAIRHMQEADVLMVAVQRVEGNEGVVPAKTFEYLSLGTPVLGFGPPAGDLARVLRGTGGGAVFEHDDTEGIAAYIAGQAARAAGGLPPPRPDPAVLRAYDRRVQTGRLAAVFDSLTEKGTDHGS